MSKPSVPAVSQKLPLKSIAFAVVGGAAFYLALVAYSDFDAVQAAFARLSWSTYIALLIISLMSYSARFVRWHLFLKVLDAHVSLKESALIYFAGFALTMTPAKAGETIRSLYLKGKGVAYSTTLGAFVSERLLDVLAVGTLSTLLFLALTDYQQVVWLGAGGVLFILLGLRLGLVSWVLALLPAKNIVLHLRDFHDVIRDLLVGRSLFWAFPLSLFAWLCQGVSLWLIMQALAVDLSLWVVIGVYCLSILVGAASFIPGGLGTTEASIVILLGLLGVDNSIAVAGAILCRVVTLWLAVSIGVVSMARLARSQRL